MRVADVGLPCGKLKMATILPERKHCPIWSRSRVVWSVGHMILALQRDGSIIGHIYLYFTYDIHSVVAYSG